MPIHVKVSQSPCETIPITLTETTVQGMADFLLILAYHRVGQPDPRARYRGQYVTPSHLRFQIACAKLLGFQFFTLSEALGRSGKRAVVTFDDGYRNNLTLGLPVLEAAGVPATVFVVTGDVGKNQVVWSEAGETNPADLMTWDELKILEDKGWEIGSHCSEHVHLAEKTPEVQRRLVLESFDALKLRRGSASPTFAYPYGSFNEVTRHAVKEAGFACAVSTRAGVNQRLDDTFALRRIPMKGYRFDHFFRTLKWLARPLISGKE